MPAATVNEPEPVPLQLLQPLVSTPEPGPIIASVDNIITASSHPSADHDTDPDGLEQNATSHDPQAQVPDTTPVDHGNASIFDEDSASNVSVTQTQSSGSTTDEQSSESSTKWKRKMRKALCGTALANICAVLGLVTAVVWWVLEYKFSVWTARNDALQACYNAMAAGNSSKYCTKLIASGVQKPPFDRRSIMDRPDDDLFAKYSLFKSATTTLVLASIVGAWIWSRPRLRTPRRLCISMARGICGTDVKLAWSGPIVSIPSQEKDQALVHHFLHSYIFGNDPEDIDLDMASETDFGSESGDLNLIRDLATYSCESLPLLAMGEATDCDLDTDQESDAVPHTMEKVSKESDEAIPHGLDTKILMSDSLTALGSRECTDDDDKLRMIRLPPYGSGASREGADDDNKFRMIRLQPYRSGGKREGADDDNKFRMIRLPPYGTGEEQQNGHEHQVNHPTTPASPEHAWDSMPVAFVAASLLEFEDYSAQESGYPYLAYVEGEVFDIDARFI